MLKNDFSFYTDFTYFLFFRISINLIKENYSFTISYLVKQYSLNFYKKKQANSRIALKI
jgi:hypothetical protein